MAGSLMSMVPPSFSNFGSNIGSAFRGLGQDIGLIPRKRRRFTGNPHLDPTPEQVQAMTGEGELSFNEELAAALAGMKPQANQLRAPRPGKFGPRKTYAKPQPPMAQFDNRSYAGVMGPRKRRMFGYNPSVGGYVGGSRNA
jgi:hypothetical protein